MSKSLLAEQPLRAVPALKPIDTPKTCVEPGEDYRRLAERRHAWSTWPDGDTVTGPPLRSSSMSIKGKPTSFDIAYLAGVSQPTVSRALRGSPLVNEETRNRILDIARQLNYKVDKNASSLRSQQSGTIALLLFEDPTPDDSHINPFFLSMLGSITRACARRGFDLLVSFQQLSNDWHRDYEDSNKADGLILLGYGDYLDYREKLEKLSAQGTHFVRWGAVMEGQPGVSIGCDNFQGGLDITEHLIKKGHQQIAFLGDTSESCPELRDRFLGYQQALKNAGIETNPALQIDAITTENSGYESLRELLSRGVAFDAIFGASDAIAIGAMRALLEHGYKIPSEIAVAGFDDIPLASYVNPPLTTVLQDTKQAGELLVDNLLRLIHNEPVVSTTIAPRLIVRRSCGG